MGARKDGRFCVRVYIGRTETGKPKYKYCYGNTQKEAEKAAQEIRYRLFAGERIEAGCQPFSHWADRYLASKQNDVTPSYYVGLRGRVEWWKSLFGGLRAGDILVSEIQKALDELAEHNPHTGKPTAKQTLIDYRADLQNVLNLALMDRAITFNPASSSFVKIPRRAPRSQRFALNEVERRRIEEMPHRAQLAALLLMYAGLRLGELLAIRPIDVDLCKCAVRVSRTVYYLEDNNTAAIKYGGKTSNAVREAPFPRAIAGKLQELMADIDSMELLYHNEQGQPLSKSQWKRLWASYLTDLNAEYGQPIGQRRSKFDPRGIQMGIRPFTAHCLRHPYVKHTTKIFVFPYALKS